MKETAQRAALATLVAGGIVVLALALWQLKLLAALLFLAFILAAAMRPTVERLAQRGIPRGVGIGLHYVVLIGLIAGFLWLVVPRAIDQVDDALGGLPDDALRPRRAGAPVDRDQARHPRRPPAPARGPALRRAASSTRPSR